jgi:predicted phage terminase large subunit-like protein
VPIFDLRCDNGCVSLHFLPWDLLKGEWMEKITAEAVHGFSNGLLLKNFDSPKKTPQFHWNLWDLACSEARKVAIAAPRGHAKSTAVTHTFGLACICLRIKKHLLIISDTEGQAIQFLGNIKTELLENEELREAVKFKRFIKDRETEVIGEFEDFGKFRIVAKGAGQRLRGMIWRNHRPDLILCDDLENDETVMNDLTRQKQSDWFYNALMPCGSDDCDIRVVGTILHMDSILEGLMPEFEGEHTVTDGLSYVSTEEPESEYDWISVRYRAHNEDYTKLLWPDKFPRRRLEAIRKEYIKKGSPEGYAQEYLNYPIDLEHAYFRTDDLLPLPKEDANKFGEYYATADLAISELDQRAFTVITVGRLTDERYLDIVDVRRFRGDARQIIDELFAVQTAYRPSIFGIEKENISKALGPILYEEMGRPGKPFINIELLMPVKDKQTRARSIQARIKAHTVRFNKEASWWPALHTEIVQFPRGTYKDQVDALAWLGHLLDKMVDVPTTQELEDLEYDEELLAAQQDEWDDAYNYTGY